MKKYNLNDKLKCKKRLSLYEDHTKNNIFIEEGAICQVIFAQHYDECSYYEIRELTKNNDGITARLYNDKGHEIVDWHFSKILNSHQNGNKI